MKMGIVELCRILMLSRHWILILAVFSIAACGVKPIQKIQKMADRHMDDPFYAEQLTGIYFYDPETGKTIYGHNENRLFTPASNTKILTLAVGMDLLPDSIPAAFYTVNGDAAVIKPTGDPSTLHPYFKDSSLVSFIAQQEEVSFHFPVFDDHAFGPGWAWEDYDTYFSPERCPFPIYGNVVQIKREDSIAVIPRYIKENVVVYKNEFSRDLFSNLFFIDPVDSSERFIPYIWDRDLAIELIAEATGKKVGYSVSHFDAEFTDTLFSISSDSLFKRMMVVSDNFLSEQILVLASAMISDTLSTSISIEYALDSLWKTLPQRPRWVDGSGLSRYNLISPRSLVCILDQLVKQHGWERIQPLFPIGGLSGTLTDWFGSDTTEPYIFAKSGSLGNNYNLSGYLITDSGKRLVFSFMNNHHMKPTSSVKQKMENLFRYIKAQY